MDRADRNVARLRHTVRDLEERVLDESKSDPLTRDLASWSRNPNKWDISGVDTPLPDYLEFRYPDTDRVYSPSHLDLVLTRDMGDIPKGTVVGYIKSSKQLPPHLEEEWARGILLWKALQTTIYAIPLYLLSQKVIQDRGFPQSRYMMTGTAVVSLAAAFFIKYPLSKAAFQPRNDYVLHIVMGMMSEMEGQGLYPLLRRELINIADSLDMPISTYCDPEVTWHQVHMELRKMKRYKNLGWREYCHTLRIHPDAYLVQYFDESRIRAQGGRMALDALVVENRIAQNLFRMYAAQGFISPIIHFKHTKYGSGEWTPYAKQWLEESGWIQTMNKEPIYSRFMVRPPHSYLKQWQPRQIISPHYMRN